MTTMVMHSSIGVWSWFSTKAAKDQPEEDKQQAKQQVAEMRTTQPQQNPPDLGIYVSDESSAGESLG